jgi:uncharacterized protein
VSRGVAGPLAGAYAAFAATFRGPRERFWQRMTLTGLALGATALLSRRDLRRTRFRLPDVAAGAIAAVGLYAIFRVGDRVARRVMPTGGRDIDSVYDLRSVRPGPELAARLALVIGPAEELFWRGLVQRRLSERLGTWPGAAAAAAAYGGAHAVTGNLTLVGAATVAGGYWSALAAAGTSMGALIVSHAVWDLAIFLVAPTAPARSSA